MPRAQYQIKHHNPEVDILAGRFALQGVSDPEKDFGNGWTVARLGAGVFRVTLGSYVTGTIVATIGRPVPLAGGTTVQHVTGVVPSPQTYFDLAVCVAGVPTDLIGATVNFIAHVQRSDLPSKTDT